MADQRIFVFLFFCFIVLLKMCGIIGYLGKNSVLPILVDGLKRLEYRGYDSSGIVVSNKEKFFSVKTVGKIKEFEKRLFSEGEKKLQPFQGVSQEFETEQLWNVGLAHTRWATHGSPTEENAHPHSDCEDKIWIVHNGIIENYKKLSKMLIKKGHNFTSETDSEVIAHLIEDIYDGDLLSTVIKALELVKGAYGLVVMHRNEPDKLIAAKLSSPLLMGIGDGEMIVASDVSAVLRHTKQVIYLDDGEVAEIKKDHFNIYDLASQKINKDVQQIHWDVSQAEKQGYPYFMLKEIFEQPDTVANSIRGRLVVKAGKAKLGGLDNVAEKIREIENIIIVSCGTAQYAGLIGKCMIEEYAGILTSSEFASEFRYRKPILNKGTALIAISQSGETADTLAAIYEAKEKGILNLGIVNTVGSTVSRVTDAGVYNHSGPEIAVASTKAFVSQLAVLALMTIFLGRQRNMSFVTGQRIAEELEALPEKIKIILTLNDKIRKIAEKYYNFKNFAFLGRKYNYPVAIEGALKLKEISYIHSEGFPSGELKHGAIALIDEDFPSVFIAPLDSVYEKNLSNMEEVKARRGPIIAVTTEGNESIHSVANEVIYIPKTLEMLTPILSVIPLQLFAYHMAVLNNRDVDKPRNLAKSVTVE